jgi:ribulose-5-phosphate 4-epimerase/fuculose-1-phosphate aldolase
MKSQQPLDESEAREKICAVGRSLFDRGYAHATAGNISVRLKDGFLITPTDACLGFLEPDRLALVRADGEKSSGDRASKTLALHRRIYDRAPDASCVIHTHSHHLVSLTLSGVWSSASVLPPITPYFVMKVGQVPLIPYGRPGSDVVADDVSTAVSDAMQRGQPLRAVMLERLGPVAWGASPLGAMAVLEELEETAKLWAGMPTKPTALLVHQIQELEQAFGVRW